MQVIRLLNEMKLSFIFYFQVIKTLVACMRTFIYAKNIPIHKENKVTREIVLSNSKTNMAILIPAENLMTPTNNIK